MADSMFIEEGEYYIWCSATLELDGGFVASALFERKSDHAAMKTLIPAMRHVIKERFEDPQEALSAAAQMALAKAGHPEEVGL